MYDKQFVILTSNDPYGHIGWQKACEKYNVNYRIVDLTTSNWFEETLKEKFHYLLAKPEGLNSKLKQLYDERIYILSDVLGFPLFPSSREIYIYENKRFLSFWLKALNIPHPSTHIFYYYDEALKFILNTNKTYVAKTNIGASGSGVKILKTKEEKNQYLLKTFKGKGAPKRTGPNLEKGGLIKRGIKYIFRPSLIKNKIKTYKLAASENQKGFVILQEYIPHQFEWRVVRIGNSYFAHKKLKQGEKTSGSLIKSYDKPPYTLLDFVKKITDKHMLYSQAVDIFDFNGTYLVNEMQCVFGQSDDYQMIVDGKKGRFIKDGVKWIFEEGDFAINACFDLRMDFILNTLLKG